MFETKTSFTDRLSDAVDLIIDFATLGEYGLEPVGRTAEPCEARHRARSSRRDAHQSPGRAAARARA